MAAAIDRGLTIADFKELDIGDIIDYIISWNNQKYDSEKEDKENIKVATQDDFDKF